MAASDVQDTLDQALAETGLDKANVVHRPRLLSGNGPCYLSGELASYLKDGKACHIHAARLTILKRRAKLKDGTKPSRTASCWKTTFTRGSREPDRGIRRPLQTPTVPRKP